MASDDTVPERSPCYCVLNDPSSENSLADLRRTAARLGRVRKGVCMLPTMEELGRARGAIGACTMNDTPYPTTAHGILKVTNPFNGHEEYFRCFFNPGQAGIFVGFGGNPEERKVDWFYVAPGHFLCPHKCKWSTGNVYDLRNVGGGHDITYLEDGCEGQFKNRKAFLEYLYGPGGEGKERVYWWENNWVQEAPWDRCGDIGMEVAVDLPEYFFHYHTPRPRVEWFPGYENQIGMLLDVPDEYNNAKPYFGQTFRYHTERTLKADKEDGNIYRGYMAKHNAVSAAAVRLQGARGNSRQPGSPEEGAHNSGKNSVSGTSGAERPVESEQQGLKKRGRPSPPGKKTPQKPAEKKLNRKEPERAQPTSGRNGMTGKSGADRNAERLLLGKKQRGRPTKSVAEEEVAEPDDKEAELQEPEQRSV